MPISCGYCPHEETGDIYPRYPSPWKPEIALASNPVYPATLDQDISALGKVVSPRETRTCRY